MSIEQQILEISREIVNIKHWLFLGGGLLACGLALAIYLTNKRVKRDSIIKDKQINEVKEEITEISDLLKKKTNEEDSIRAVVTNQYHRLDALIKNQNSEVKHLIDEIKVEMRIESLENSHKFEEFKANVENYFEVSKKIRDFLLEAGVDAIAQKKKQ